ncbi:MAG: outer membrane lipoprotein carrier protein LolA [Parvularculaceae bacterium]
MNIAMLTLAAITCADAGLSLGGMTAIEVAAAAPVAAMVEAAPAAVDKPVILAAATPAESGATVAAPESIPEDLVFANESDETVADKVLAYLDGIDTLQGDFTQVAPSGAISTGKFYLRRPGLLRFEYDEPSPMLIVATGGTVFVRDEALETTDSYPVGKTPLKFLLRKKVELDDARVAAVDRGADSAAVTFVSDEEDNEGELSVIVRAPDMQLEQWIVRDPQNGVTIVTLDNVVAGASIPNRLFAAPKAESPFLKN